MVKRMRFIGEEAEDHQQQGEREDGAPTHHPAGLTLISGRPQRPLAINAPATASTRCGEL
jgi:hypothetical protein